MELSSCQETSWIFPEAWAARFEIGSRPPERRCCHDECNLPEARRARTGTALALRSPRALPVVWGDRGPGRGLS
jgi:hypothetical protein